MSALLPNLRSSSTDDHDQYVVSHGKSGALGVFTAAKPLRLRRGQRVLVQTARGHEVGAILCPASLRQARILGAVSSGPLLRFLTDEDEGRCEANAVLEQELFTTARAWAQRENLPMEVLDAELLFDQRNAVVQFVGSESECERLGQALEQHLGLAVRFENLAAPHDAEEHAGGCNKPDCGQSEGGCTDCSSGGGCSSCGSTKVDLRPYFSHLRDRMEQQHRIPLT